MAKQERFAARSFDEPSQYLDGCGFSRAIRPEEADDLAATNLEADSDYGADRSAMK